MAQQGPPALIVAGENTVWNLVLPGATLLLATSLRNLEASGTSTMESRIRRRTIGTASLGGERTLALILAIGSTIADWRQTRAVGGSSSGERVVQHPLTTSR